MLDYFQRQALGEALQHIGASPRCRATAENKNNEGLESALLIRVLIQRTASVPVGDPLATPHTAAARGLIECMHIVQGGEDMRIVVDLNRCQGYAQCVPLAPDVLKLSGEEALMYDPNPDDSLRLQVLRAAASCPVQAILVDRLDEKGEKA
jgi:ferredoxin